MKKVPYVIVLGDKEQDSKQIAVRKRGNEDLGTMAVDAFCSIVSEEIRGKK